MTARVTRLMIGRKRMFEKVHSQSWPIMQHSGASSILLYCIGEECVLVAFVCVHLIFYATVCLSTLAAAFY